MASAQRLFEFGGWLLDEERGLLRHGESVVALTPRALDLLAFLVRNSDRTVSKHELLDAVWAGVHVEENNVEQQISLLRKLLGDGFIETAPRRGYRFVAEVGWPSTPALDGGNEAAGAPVSPLLPLPITPPPAEAAPRTGIGPRVALVLAGLLTFAGAYAVRLRWEASQPWPARVHRLAVLPFASLSGADEADERLGLGLADAVITRLGRHPALSLRPTAAVTRYRGLVDPIAAGRELEVDAVLQTTFRRENDQLRVRSQLVDATRGTTIWTAQYDLPAGELSRVEDSIAGALAARFGTGLDEAARARLVRHRDVTPAAYAAYLEGRWHWNRRTPSEFREAERSFREAIGLDAGYAPSLAGLADALLSQARDDQARSSAERALALDDSLAEPHATLGFLAFFHDRDPARARAELTRALELNPSYATAYQWLAYVDAAQRRCPQAIEAIRRGREVDPTSLTIATDVAQIQYYCGDYREAEREIRSALRLDPSFVQAHLVLASILLEAGRFDEAGLAIQTASRSAEIDPRSFEVELLARSGDLGGAERHAQESKLDLGVGGYFAARLLAAMGRIDEAVTALGAAETRHESSLMLLGVDPGTRALRSDPRVRSMLVRLGLG